MVRQKELGMVRPRYFSRTRWHHYDSTPNRLSTSLEITRKLRHLSNLKRRRWTVNIHSPVINSMIITRISNSQVSSRWFDSRIASIRREQFPIVASMIAHVRSVWQKKLLLDVRKSTNRIDTRQSSDNTPRYVTSNVTSWIFARIQMFLDRRHNATTYENRVSCCVMR